MTLLYEFTAADSGERQGVALLLSHDAASRETPKFHFALIHVDIVMKMTLIERPADSRRRFARQKSSCAAFAAFASCVDDERHLKYRREYERPAFDSSLLEAPELGRGCSAFRERHAYRYRRNRADA